MKKLLSIAAAGLMMAGLSSCSKSYTCDCVEKYDQTASDPAFEEYTWPGYTETYSFTSSKKKKESEDWCKSYETEASSSYTSTEYDYEKDREVVVTYTESAVTTCSLK